MSGILEKSVPKLRVLNQDDTGQKCDKSAVDASKELQKLMLRMKSDVMSEDGSGVDYEALKKSPLFRQYKELAAALKHVDLASLSEEEKMAFFINIYNALTIHGLVECTQLPKSVLDVQRFWKVTGYNIGGHDFNLDDMEHGVLRGNRPHPSSKDPPFTAKDPRLKYVVKKVDPRLHFALVCGAKSCPAIQVYTAANLEAALMAATKNFIEQEVQVCKVAKEIRVSRILQWYRGDFGDNDLEAIRWTLPYLSESKQLDLKDLLWVLEKQGMVDLNYNDYNWQLNKL